MEERQVFVGIDVSKKQLDIAFRPEGKAVRVLNNRRGITKLARQLEKLGPLQLRWKRLEASKGSWSARWRRSAFQSRW